MSRYFLYKQPLHTWLEGSFSIFIELVKIVHLRLKQMQMV